MTKQEILERFPDKWRKELAKVIKEESIDEWLTTPGGMWWDNEPPGKYILECSAAHYNGWDEVQNVVRIMSSGEPS